MLTSMLTKEEPCFLKTCKNPFFCLEKQIFLKELKKIPGLRPGPHRGGCSSPPNPPPPLQAVGRVLAGAKTCPQPSPQRQTSGNETGFTLLLNAKKLFSQSEKKPWYTGVAAPFHSCSFLL